MDDLSKMVDRDRVALKSFYKHLNETEKRLERSREKVVEYEKLPRRTRFIEMEERARIKVRFFESRAARLYEAIAKLEELIEDAAERDVDTRVG